MNSYKQQSMNSSMLEALSCKNQPIDLFRKSVDWFLYDGHLRLHPSYFLHPSYSESLFLQVVEQNSLSLFSLSAFSFTHIHNSQDSMEMGMLSFYILTSTRFTDTERYSGSLLQRSHIC